MQPMARDRKYNCVDVLLLEAIEIHQLSTVRIYVREWVLHLAGLFQGRRDRLVAKVHELKKRIIRCVLQCKLALEHVAWIRLSERSVSKPWHDLPFLHGSLHVTHDEF